MTAPDGTAAFADLTARHRALLESMFAGPKAFGRGCVAHIADLAQCRRIGTTLWSGHLPGASPVPAPRSRIARRTTRKRS